MTRANATPWTPTGGDSIRLFAAELRELRHRAGNPTLQSLHSQTGISVSVLSDAFAGRRMPTANTVSALETAFDVEAGSLLASREQFAKTHAAAPEASAPARRRPLRLALISVMMTVVLVGVGWSAVSPADVSAGSAAQERQVASTLPPVARANPAATVCVNDAVVARTVLVADGTVRFSFMRSKSCDAVWGEMEWVDASASHSSVAAVVYPCGDRYGGRDQDITLNPPGAEDSDTVATGRGLIREVSRFAFICATVTTAAGQESLSLMM